MLSTGYYSPNSANLFSPSFLNKISPSSAQLRPGVPFSTKSPPSSAQLRSAPLKGTPYAFSEETSRFPRENTCFRAPPPPITLQLTHTSKEGFSTSSLSHSLRIRPSSLNPRLCESAALVVLAPQTRNAIRHSGGRAPFGRLGSVAFARLGYFR